MKNLTAIILSVLLLEFKDMPREIELLVFFIMLLNTMLLIIKAKQYAKH